MKETEEEMLLAFERSLEAGGIRSRFRYLASLREFLSFAKAEGHSYDNLPLGLWESYSKKLLELGMERRTVNNKFMVVKKWGKWLVKSGRINDNPLADAHTLRVGPWIPRNILGIEDMGKFLCGFRLRNPNDIMAKAIIEFLYGSGIRISEAVSVKEKDIDKKGLTARIFETKSRKERKVPITEAFAKALELYYDEARDLLTGEEDRREDRVFPKKACSSLKGRVNYILAREARNLGLEKITSHSMRHMAATHMLKKGAGIRHVQAFLGHERISATQSYTRIFKDDLKKVIETCHPLEAFDVDEDA